MMGEKCSVLGGHNVISYSSVIASHLKSPAFNSVHFLSVIFLALWRILANFFSNLLFLVSKKIAQVAGIPRLSLANCFRYCWNCAVEDRGIQT